MRVRDKFFFVQTNIATRNLLFFNLPQSHGGHRDSSSEFLWAHEGRKCSKEGTEETLSPTLPLYGEGEPSGKSLALVPPLAIEANEGTEERLNVSLSRNEGRAVPCSTEVKERGWG